MAEINAITGSRFYCSFNGLEERLVKSVSEVQFKGQVSGAEKAVASGKGGKTLRQTTSASREENPEITLEVYLCQGDMDWYNWMKATTPTSDGGDGKWADNRKEGSIVGYNPGDEEILRWNLYRCWPKSYKVSDLSSESKDLCFETFQIVCEKIIREK